MITALRRRRAARQMAKKKAKARARLEPVRQELRHEICAAKHSNSRILYLNAQHELCIEKVLSLRRDVEVLKIVIEYGGLLEYERVRIARMNQRRLCKANASK